MTADAKSLEAEHERKLDRIIAEYSRRIDTGEQVDCGELIEQNPDIADLLRSHFDDVHVTDELVRSALGETKRPGSLLDTDIYRTTHKSPPPPVDSLSDSAMPAEQRSGKALFGRYRIEKVLGAGAMGEVYRAFDTKLNRQVALKVPKRDQNTNAELMKRFQVEAQAAAVLNHRNICSVFDTGTIDGCHFITMAYIEGRPLTAYIRRGKDLPQRAVAQLVRKLALALADAHDRDVVHRDLKPANIMVDQQKEPVIMDFGLASMSQQDRDTRLTEAGTILGTPAYMSPEQVDGDTAKIDSRSDMFSLGIIFYELLCGRLPFEGSLGSLLAKIMKDDPVPLHSRRADVSPELETICMKMMSKTREHRYGDMREVADALKAYLVNPLDSHNETHQSIAETGAFARVATDLDQDRNDSEELPVRQNSLVSALQTWQGLNRRSRVASMLGAGGLALVFAIVLVYQLASGTLVVEVNDDNLTVLVDGKHLQLSDGKWQGTKFASEHRLALQLHGVNIPFDAETNTFSVNGGRLSVKLQDAEIVSDRFAITRRGKAVLQIRYEPENIVESASTPGAPSDATIERLQASFSGKVTLRPDGLVEIFYDFSESKQLDDWIKINDNAIWSVKGGWLVCERVQSTEGHDTRLFHKASFRGSVQEIHYDGQGRVAVSAILFLDPVARSGGYGFHITERRSPAYVKLATKQTRLLEYNFGRLDPQRVYHIDAAVNDHVASLSIDNKVYFNEYTVPPEKRSYGDRIALKLANRTAKYDNIRIVGRLAE